MNLNLKGKKALVTGGSRGIGLAIKKALEAEGVFVISWSRSEGQDLMESLPELPKISILINNLGGMGTSIYNDKKDCMKKNYGIMVELTQRFLEQNKKGIVITISSLYGKEKGRHDTSPWFVAAKAAQIAYMKTMAGRLPNIRFNTICPGVIDTGKKYKELPSSVGKPEDIAGIVTFLCSDKASHINGACITVDGGEGHAY